MKTTIGKYDRHTGQVPVVFEEGDVRHERQVNACLKADGTYDRKATSNRIEEVARGVAVKIGLGLIVQPEPVDEPGPSASETIPAS